MFQYDSLQEEARRVSSKRSTNIVHYITHMKADAPQISAAKFAIAFFHYSERETETLCGFSTT